MIFGNPNKFAIEIYHEPSSPEFMGFGRMCLHIQGTTIGDPLESHCSLFHAVDRITEVAANLNDYWDERFTGHTGEEIFAWLDTVLYSGGIGADEDEVAKFDFLTNTGEQFDNFKTFIYCSPEGVVFVPVQGRDSVVTILSCSGTEFSDASAQLELWFRENTTA